MAKIYSDFIRGFDSGIQDFKIRTARTPRTPRTVRIVRG